MPRKNLSVERQDPSLTLRMTRKETLRIIRCMYGDKRKIVEDFSLAKKTTLEA